MKSDVKEVRTVSIVAWGGLIVTLFITDRLSTDPVNVGKQLALSALAFTLIPFLSIFNRAFYREFKLLILALLLFLGSMCVSVFSSINTFERGLYGSFGRNTGLLTYVSLALFFLAALQVMNVQSFQRIVKFFLAAGILNIAYCLASSNGYELFAWINPYNSVLGTFGNPNFIGAFMGMTSTVLFVQALSSINSWKKTLSYLLLLLLSLYVIFLSSALQGILVAGFGISMSVYFYLRSLDRFRILPHVFLTSLFMGAIVVVLGILRVGPLSSILYKPSVTFRGEYWKTGLNMWWDNPIFGVGVDSYGQFYRSYRSLEATISPGLEVTTDAAHNVYIDILAGTGILGFLGYTTLNCLILYSAYRFIRRSKGFDPIFYSLFLGWITYQLQSIISINQIGLAIWGWILGGSTLAYSRLSAALTSIEVEKGTILSGKKRKSKQDSSELLEPTILVKVFIFFLFGFLIALPPFLRDSKMRTFLAGKGTPAELVALSKDWPRDSNRMSRTYVILAQNNSVTEAKELAAFTTTIFPNDYSSWYALYQIAAEGSPEREAYKKRLNQIDPFNPEYQKK
jgi:O-antigen ligase